LTPRCRWALQPRAGMLPSKKSCTSDTMYHMLSSSITILMTAVWSAPQLHGISRAHGKTVSEHAYVPVVATRPRHTVS
jgi:hypothetical protein